MGKLLEEFGRNLHPAGRGKPKKTELVCTSPHGKTLLRKIRTACRTCINGTSGIAFIVVAARLPPVAVGRSIAYEPARTMDCGVNVRESR